MNKDKKEIPIKPAATILCIRETESKSIEVLLLKRNKALKFASGFWVFPGGKIEPEEFEQTPDELSAAKIAAVRETVEEAGLETNVNQLKFFCHWTTPNMQSKRFGTYFFAAHIERNKDEITIDDSEIKDYKWISPQRALDQFLNSELHLLPPTFVSLQRIRKCNSYQEVIKELDRVEPFYVSPHVTLQDGVFYSLYEGDAGYDLSDIHREGSRHRLIGNMKTGGYHFIHENCDIFPINGGHH